LNRAAGGGGGGGFGGGDFRPQVAPGVYKATLYANGKQVETSITVKGDPRLKMTPEDYQAQQRSVAALQALLSQTHDLINNTDLILEQLADLKVKLKGAPGNEAVIADIDKAVKETETLRNTLRRPAPAMNYRQRPELCDELRSLMSAVDGAVARPSEQQMQRTEELREETAAVIEKYEQILTNEVAKVNQQMSTLPQIVAKSVKSLGKP
jgi:small-conductance mechanosensitive channel